jgi:1,4-dihydroxy-2-naphthoate octaprenyltransferase
LLVVGILGFIGASTYSLENYGTKYSGLGDFSVFVLMGPLMALGAGIAASGAWSWTLVMVSVPVGFFVALILHGNNIHDIPIDRRAGATTLAIVLGFQASKTYYLLLLFGGYAAVGGLVVFDMAPVSTLLTWLTLPLALRHFTIIREAQNPLNPDLGKLRFRAARLHLLVGLLYVIGFMVPVLL